MYAAVRNSVSNKIWNRLRKMRQQINKGPRDYPCSEPGPVEA